MLVTLAPLDRASARAPAERLLAGALPLDRIDAVCDEKLFGSDGARQGRTIGAFAPDGALVGVLAQAGRFIKLLAVDPAHRRRGVGARLLDDAAAHAGGALRVGDHPGNYLSPGVDERYDDGLAFLRKRGFVEQQRVENLRAPYPDNPLVSAARAAALAAAAAQLGYRVLAPDAALLPRVLDFVTRDFAAVWAHEVALAARGPRRALFVALAPDGAPVAFAAADGNNQGLGWFGPAGTHPAHRGKRLGEALLLACLVAVQGLPDAGVIAWIGPKAFYARACAAVFDRRFVQLERPA